MYAARPEGTPLHDEKRFLGENSPSVDAYHAQIGMKANALSTSSNCRLLSVWGASFGMRQW